MKAFFRHWVRAILKFLAQRRLARVKPTVVGVTGSVGKTSAKEAIARVLERRFRVKKSEKNYNTDFGILLTLLDQSSAYSSASQWARVLWTSFLDTFKRPDPYDIFVVEMGVDKPGDMNEILDVLRPNIMVFLTVKDVHRAEGQFPNREAILEEKSKACFAVPANGWVILNEDDTFVRQLIGKIPCNTLTIGRGESCELRAKDVETSESGLRFTLCYEGKEVPVHLQHVLGDCHVTIVLAAIAVGFISGLNWRTIEAGLKDYELPPGRMNKIEGVNQSLIIDSSYNASPDTMEEALKVLGLFGGRKIAALGTMNELGELSDSAHVKVGKLAAQYADLLMAVGEQAQNLAEGAHRAGMSASMIHVFRNSKEAGIFLASFLERGDVLLVKGSQNRVRMESVVKACMKEPEKARQLLIRQEPYWLSHS